MSGRWLTASVALALLGAAVWSQFRDMREELSRQTLTIDESWANVELALQRRAEAGVKLAGACREIPVLDSNIIKRVETSAGEVVRAVAPRDRLKANVELDAALDSLSILLDQAAVARTDSRLPGLREELAEASNELAVERTAYNEAVQRYNTHLALFPNNVAASLFGYERRDLYFLPSPQELP